MKTLVLPPLPLLLLLLLGCSRPSQGLILKKCYLKDQVEAAAANLPLVEGHMSDRNIIVAKSVCFAERLAGFDTTKLMEVSEGKLDQDHHGLQGPGPGHSDAQQNFEIAPVMSRMCYGVFQLSNILSCNDSVNSTYNICNTPCNKFLDDDLTDDVKCLFRFFQSPPANGTAPPPVPLLMTRLHYIFNPVCGNVTYLDYFDSCPPPPN